MPAGQDGHEARYASDNDIRTVISTDYLREVQRLYIPADQSPVLAKVSHTAWELSGDPTPGGIIAGFTSHADAVFPAVEAVAAKLAPRRQLLDHIAGKEQQRAPGSETRNWRANARVLMTIQDFLSADAARHAILRMRVAQPIPDGGFL